ncbi:MAG: ABC transporter permease, partial [Alphaproteobacteria bacterium]|nr:ABC transporter permease [Alphaproteobacteria bacterium]
AMQTLNWPLAAAMSVAMLALFAALLGLYGRMSRRWAEP